MSANITVFYKLLVPLMSHYLCYNTLSLFRALTVEGLRYTQTADLHSCGRNFKKNIWLEKQEDEVSVDSGLGPLS